MTKTARILLLALSLHGALAAAAVPGESGAADESPQQLAAMQRRQELFLQAATGDAPAALRLLLAAQALSPILDEFRLSPVARGQWQEVRARALQDGAGDAVVQAVLLCYIEHPDASERSAAIDALLAALPENGYFGLILLAQPEVQGDAQLQRQVLRQMAEARRFTGYYTELLHSAIGLFTNLPAHLLAPAAQVSPDEEASLPVSVAFSLVALASPSFHGIMKLCRAASEENRADCRRVGQRLAADADILLDKMIGLILFERNAADATEKNAVVSERRRLHWQQEQLIAFWSGSASHGALQRRYWELLASESELTTMQRTLEAMNLPLDPPTGWRSQAEKLAELEAKQGQR